MIIGGSPTPPTGFLLWLEQRIALADAAIAAAQAVIGQCDCIMHEMPDQDPKRAWYKARDAYFAARKESTPRGAA